MSKQTALQWFVDKLPHSIETQFSKQIQQALEMEQEQMIDAYIANSVIRVRTKAEQYYNETYGVKGRENKTVVEKDKVIKVEPKLGEWGDYI
jgi:hypothetical protein